MATTFTNKIVKEVGTVPILAIETDAGTRITIVGFKITNISEFPAHASVIIHDSTSVEGYFMKDVLVPPNSSLHGVAAGEKLILDTENQVYVVADQDESFDAVISYVEIV